MSIEALKLALEAITTYLSESPDPSEEAVEGLCDARALIAKALAEQPAQQCWKCGDMDSAFQAKCSVPACGMKEQPAQPRQEPVDWEAVAADQAMTIAMMKAERKPWQGLTDEEVKAIFDSVPTASCQSYDHWRSLVARAIEAKLREKNT